jgi:hypothetical protein
VDVPLTAVATLGSGEHYGLDLVFAVPYAVGMYWLMMPSRSRGFVAAPPHAAASLVGCL